MQMMTATYSQLTIINTLSLCLNGVLFLQGVMLNIVKVAFGVVDGEQPEYEVAMVVEHHTIKKISRYFCHLL